MTLNPALSKIARWFSQLGSLIATLEFGSTRCRRSAPIRSPPVPPRAWAVSTRPCAISGESAPSSMRCTAAS